MYERTQQWLVERNLAELHLFRGMRGAAGSEQKTLEQLETAGRPIPVRVQLNPLNSWTMRYRTAHRGEFSGHEGYLLTAREFPSH
jgi:hypothetical protein